MKKLVVLLIAVISFSAVSAQRGNDMRRMNDRNVSVNAGASDDHNRYRYPPSRSYYRNDHRYHDRGHRRGFGRRKRHYDRRAHDHRNYRSYNNYERNRRMHHAEMHRQQNSRAFGNGVVVGAVAGAVLGAVIAR